MASGEGGASGSEKDKASKARLSKTKVTHHSGQKGLKALITTFELKYGRPPNHLEKENAIGNDCQDDDPNYVRHISGDDEDEDEDDGGEGGDDDDSCGVGDDVDRSNEDGQDDHEDDLGGGS